MAFSSPSSTFITPFPNFSVSLSPLPSLQLHSSSSTKTNAISLNPNHSRGSDHKWRTRASFFPSKKSGKDLQTLKQQLLDDISKLDCGADATPQDQQRIDQMVRKLEAQNPTKAPLQSDLLNGKWELLYTTSAFILEAGRPKFLRSKAKYQAINTDTLRAQNMESRPLFNQVTADLKPINAQTFTVKFDYFKILGLIPLKAPENAVGSLKITYLDEDLRISRGNQGNLFILKMVDPSYRVPN